MRRTHGTPFMARLRFTNTWSLRCLQLFEFNIRSREQGIPDACLSQGLAGRTQANPQVCPRASIVIEIQRR